MKYDWGYTGVSMPNGLDLLVLANTPGIPLEWVYAACWVPRSRRARIREMIGAEGYSELGRDNANSVIAGDGLKLLRAIGPAYSGPVPLWSQLELEADERSDRAIAEELGVNRLRVWRWRTNQIFDPLTGCRVVRSRGGKLL